MSPVTPRTAPKPVPVPAAAPPAAKDPRYLALRNFAISISVFNIFGYTLLGFEQPWLWPIIAVLTAYVTEIAFEVLSAWAQRRTSRFRGNGMRGLYEFLLPSHITALAANMLLYANDQILPVLFATFVGVAGKHALQAPVAGRMRHFMNPSNFGITVTLVCYGSWVSIAPPYEFTENANTFFRVAIPLIIVTSGTVINALLTKKVALIVGWLGGFVIQALIRHWVWDVAIFSALGPMSGVAFVLFTNYMISDPGTTPSKPRNQFMFGSWVGMVYGVLMLFNVVYTLFFAVTVVCGLRGAGWWVAHLIKRSRDAKASGTGLGDSIAAEIGKQTGSEAMAA
ncbi:enediyne biosynthesis protein [Kitasatospora sp. NBC_00240]|uniref:enediyne biosynthesis protein n=1 Tax=Kitasatospora sp. NBC_00240 TaxID=2903567 RepID=UPI002250D878|nr:enediyne biosynthesis protein [Kitasatospora sp. NBC_00240]MCX5210007.1 enediyne biosynthesis protein [Kitasatospora sp. NBC_00240]